MVLITIKFRKLKNDLDRTQIQLNNIHSIVVGTNYLSQKYTTDNERLKYVKELSGGTLKWSTTLQIINDGFKNIKGAWITSMQTAKNGISIQGYSLYRDKIPEITAIFANATLQSVSIAKIRELQAYKYSIFINKVVSDSAKFSPIHNEKSNYAFDSGKIQERTLDFG